MANANKIFDDVSRVFSGAMGVAQGAKQEAENSMKGFFAKMVEDQNFVTREEFEAVQQMAQNARTEVEVLRKEIEAMKKSKKPSTRTRANSKPKASK